MTGETRKGSAVTDPLRTPRNRAKATATAAIVPVWTTRKSDQPKRKPNGGPYASRRKTYWPPALGIIAASSAQQRAPVIVRSPDNAQAARSQPGEPTRRADPADVRKSPEPIIEPMTIIVESSSPNSRDSGLGDAPVSSGIAGLIGAGRRRP